MNKCVKSGSVWKCTAPSAVQQQLCDFYERYAYERSCLYERRGGVCVCTAARDEAAERIRSVIREQRSRNKRAVSDERTV